MARDAQLSTYTCSPLCLLSTVGSRAAQVKQTDLEGVVFALIVCEDWCHWIPVRIQLMNTKRMLMVGTALGDPDHLMSLTKSLYSQTLEALCMTSSQVWRPSAG
jgi:hypothetical protein